MTAYYNANASEHDESCLGVEMADITRTTVVADTPRQLIVRAECWFDTPEEGARQSGGCEGFAARLFTFTKSGGALHLVSMGDGQYRGPAGRCRALGSASGGAGVAMRPPVVSFWHKEETT